MTTTPNHPDEIPPRPDEEPDTQPEPAPSGSSFSAPSEGLADPTSGQTGPVAPTPDAGEHSVPDVPDDDQRTHPEDFADGYDGRQVDGEPAAPRPTPDEYVERETS